MSPPFFSLIFVNYQSATLLKRALSSWGKPLVALPHEIIIVNNDVNERDQVATLASSNIRVVQLDRNYGFGAANNQGAALATGQWLFFLNPDTEYVDGSFEALMQLLGEYPRSLGGLRLIDAFGKEEAWSSGSFPTLWQLIHNNFLGEPSRPVWQASELQKIDWVSGAALLIDRNLFQELGGFDEHFFLYFEDVDLARRAQMHGAAGWRSPMVTVKHIGGGSHNKKESQKIAYYKSQLIYFSKHRPFFETYLLKWLQRVLL